MGEAVETKASVIFISTDFNGVTDIAGIVSSMLAIHECKSFADFLISERPLDGEFDHSKDIDWLNNIQSDRDYDVQFLGLANSIFYEDIDVSNVYRFLDLQNSRFKELSYIDDSYLQMTSGRIIRRISGNRRLVNDDPHPLQELYRSKDDEDQGGKLHLFLSMKTMEREYAETWRKPGYYFHEWISDYGKSPVRVLFNILLVMGVFGIALYCTSYGTVADCIIGSCSAFFTIGLGLSGIEGQLLKILVILEGAIGFVMMTYFVVVLCDWKKLRLCY